MTKHISLDFWNTIARSNPAYGARRLRYLGDMLKCEEGEVTTALRRVKTRLDQAAEKEGASTPRLQNIEALYRELGKEPDGTAVAHIARVMDEMFLGDSPLISKDLKDTILRAYDYGYTISIASNTIFVPGSVIRQTLHQWPIAFFLFSDEVGSSKPHTDFFRRIRGRAMHANPRVTDATDIVHVGDNPICDGKVVEAGMLFIQVENPDDTVVRLTDLLDCPVNL